VLRIVIGSDLALTARLESDRAPLTVAAVRRLLPFEGTIMQGRWSGESAWVPLDDWRAASNPGGPAGGSAAVRRFDLPYENHTSFPAPGEMLLYCFGLSVTEFLLPYGPTIFNSRVGQLVGNHFATIIEGRDLLAEVGRRVLWQGAQPITIVDST